MSAKNLLDDPHHRRWAKLGISTDYSAEGYKLRLSQIRALEEEGKGPGAETHQFLASCGYAPSLAYIARHGLKPEAR